MKRLLVPATVTGRAAAFTGIRVFAIVLAAASLGVVAGCGGDERLSREEFSERLQSIDQRGSERWGRVAQRANDLNPDQPISADLKQPMRDREDAGAMLADSRDALRALGARPLVAEVDALVKAATAA